MKKIPLLLILVLLTSCTVQESLRLEEKNAVDSFVTIDDFFVDVLSDMASLSSDGTRSPMDQAFLELQALLEESGEAENLTLEMTTDQSYHLIFQTENLEKLATALGGRKSSILKENGKTLSFYLDLSNYQELKEMIPLLSNKDFETYGPEYNSGMETEEYLEMMGYLLGDRAPEAIRKSTITLLLAVPGEIVQAEHLVLRNAHEAEYTIPLTDFLLLNQPLSFSISWK